MLMQVATSTSVRQTRTPRQSSQARVGNCEKRCTDLWMLPSFGENTMPRFGRREGFPEEWLLRATSSMKAWQTYFLVHGDDFFIVESTGGVKACAEFAPKCIRVE